MKSEIDTVLERRATLADVARLMTMTLGMVAEMTNFGRVRLSAAYEEIARGAPNRQDAIVVRYIAAQLLMGTPAQGAPTPPAKH